jgi:AcrR family transcriptional regulator
MQDMGLRETKVARTRAQIVEVALDLFLDQGFGDTTMEQVAERAEVGLSTLYRYFPSKDLLLLEPLVRTLDFATLLAARPADEPLDVALGHVVREAYPGGDMERDRFVALRGVVDREPGPRARLWDLMRHATHDLEDAVRARPDAPDDALLVALAARNAFLVYELVGQVWTGRTHRSWRTAVDTVLTPLARTTVILPR